MRLTALLKFLSLKGNSCHTLFCTLQFPNGEEVPWVSQLFPCEVRDLWYFRLSSRGVAILASCSKRNKESWGTLKTNKFSMV